MIEQHKVEWQRAAGAALGAHPNNGMHLTANRAALIEELRGFEVGCAAGDAGRSAVARSFWKLNQSRSRRD